MKTNPTKKEKCSYGFDLTSNCSGCTDPRSESTHQGCTIEHGHIGCSLSRDGWPITDKEVISNPRRGVKVGDGDGKILEAFRSNKETPDSIDRRDQTYPIPDSSWEKEFDRRFYTKKTSYCRENVTCHGSIIKDFIRQTISSAVSKREVELIGEIEKIDITPRVVGYDVFVKSLKEFREIVLSILVKRKSEKGVSSSRII